MIPKKLRPCYNFKLYSAPTFVGAQSPPLSRAPIPQAGISEQINLAQCGNMSKKGLPPHNGDPVVAKELEHLYAQLSAVEALIRALKTYRSYYPELVVGKSKTA
jgi:hypothetical protein